MDLNKLTSIADSRKHAVFLRFSSQWGCVRKWPGNGLRREGHDGQGIAGAGSTGFGKTGTAVSDGAEESAAAGGLAASDAAGDGISCGADCGGDGLHGEDGVPDGAVRTEQDDQPASTGEDGAGAGV